MPERCERPSDFLFCLSVRLYLFVSVICGCVPALFPRSTSHANIPACSYGPGPRESAIPSLGSGQIPEESMTCPAARGGVFNFIMYRYVKSCRISAAAFSLQVQNQPVLSHDQKLIFSTTASATNTIDRILVRRIRFPSSERPLFLLQ